VGAYVQGVRAALPTAPCAELDLLGPTPGAWQPWTPMAIFLVQHVLFGSIGHDMWRRRVRATLGESAAVLLGHDPKVGGSNAFVIGGSLTASGFPIVAGDPHRLFEAPNVYAQVRLSCPELDVVGLTFPGVPGVQHFGHAGDVAWAVTNAMADQQALVEVPVASCVSTRETLVVRDADPVAIAVLSSEVGPALLVDGDTALCLTGPSYAAGSMLDAVLPLLRARSVEDVDAALERWVEPVNNVLVADRTGRTLHRVAGQLQVRLPRIEGRPDGVLVTANDRADPDFDALGDRFAPPHRADRLRELLADSCEWTPPSVAAVLGDVRLDHDRLLARMAGLDALSDRARANRDALLAWDRRLDAMSTEAALYVRVRDRLVLAIADAEPLAALADAAAYDEMWVPWLWLPGRVASTLGGWLEADQPLGIDVASLLAAALDVDKSSETWGERHCFSPLHALTDLGVEHPFDPSVAGRGLSGDTDCVAATGAIPGLPGSVMGPVARYVWDLADRGASRWAVPLGAAGDHRDPHHYDQFDAWSSCQLIPLEESR
jgi:penicillin amidase